MAPFSTPSFPQQDYHPNRDEKIEFWRFSMDALSLGKMTWENFLQGSPVSAHPARLLATTETGQSLLHLAVLANRADIVQEIVDKLPQLKWRRNSMNWSPLELAQFLPRENLVRLLQAQPTLAFCEQPNVAIPDRSRFESLSQVEYIPQPLFATNAIFDEIVNRTKKAKREDSIPPERIWMGIYFDKEIQAGIHPKVSIRFIDEKVGFGVFAEQRIPSCAFSGECRGVVQERKRKGLRDKVHCVRYTVWEMGKRKFILDAEKKGNFTRFINHSVKPNLSLQSVYWRGLPRLIFVALKEIAQGTQLTFDYGTFFWKECPQTPVSFE
jgi:uncharacterized protein